MKAFKGRFVFPETGAVEEGYLWVEKGRIQEFAREAPAGGEVVDLEGYIVPGLIDAHVHLSFSGGADPAREMEEEPPATTVVRAAGYLKDYLKAGITAVRDLGSRDGLAVGLARAVEQGLLAGPRIVAAGRLLTPTGGHGHRHGVEADGPDAVRRAARGELKRGARAIKLMATGGVMTPGLPAGVPMFEEAELAAGAAEAGKRRFPSAAHAQGLTGIKNALRAGITTIEHGAFDRWDEEAIRLFKEQGALLVPTLAAPDGILRGAGTVPAFMVEKTRPIAERHKENLLEAYRKGVAIAAGTDAGTPLNPHPNLARELELLAEVGLKPADVLRAATLNAARALGMEGQIGTLAPGAWADLAVLEENPLESPRAYRRVLATFLAGAPVA